MTRPFPKWLKPVASIAVLFGLAWLLPTAPVDPWKLLSLKKIATMIFALTLIQVVGAELARIMGAKAGALVTGFLGGIISSTATTASLAKRSRETSSPENVSAEILTYFAAIAAMLFEGLAIFLSGTTGFHWSPVIVFAGPILATAAMILHYSTKEARPGVNLEPTEFRVVPILKVAAFIVAILAASKILQNVFGHKGLLVLTFLVSLFEIHGSVIANVQLHDFGTIGVPLLAGLLAISVAASFVSKLFLIYALGSQRLRSQATKGTLLLTLSVLASWGISTLVY